MENQESPQTDQDVIDWILENLIEKSRTRRAVIKKLKELGLIFKAPTKKSNAAAVNKHLFMHEEDEKLRELYDEHRTEKDCLKRIMEVFNRKRSKKAVVKRMVQLGLIADESEILPPKRRRNPREEHEGMDHERRSSDESSEESSDDDEDLQPRQLVKNFNLNKRAVAKLRLELEESMKEAIEWIKESLEEAAEDFEKVSDDPDDAIPIVAFSDSQREALENPQFRALMEALSFIAPNNQDSWWKIPANMMPDDLKTRVRLLTGEEDGEDEVEEEKIVAAKPRKNKTTNRAAVVSEDEESDDDLFSRLRQQREALIYNMSDNEADREAPVKKVRIRK